MEGEKRGKSARFVLVCLVILFKTCKEHNIDLYLKRDGGL